MKTRRVLVLMFVLGVVFPSGGYALTQELKIAQSDAAHKITLDFEDLADLTAVTNQYMDRGISFEGATILGQGESLNYLHFPPRSGINVIYDDGSLVVRVVTPIYGVVV